MLDPGPSLLAVLVLGLGAPPVPPGELLGPGPRPGDACVLLVPSLYRGGPLRPCPDVPGDRPHPPLVVPLDPEGHSASDE